jgi:hypothetical protein
MSVVSSVVEIILRITRDVRSTRICKRKHMLLPTHSTRSNICSNNQTEFLCCHKYRARSTHKPTSSANQRYIRLKKYDEPFLTKWELC